MILMILHGMLAVHYMNSSTLVMIERDEGHDGDLCGCSAGGDGPLAIRGHDDYVNSLGSPSYVPSRRGRF